jgi:hypothetical protein
MGSLKPREVSERNQSFVLLNNFLTSCATLPPTRVNP